MSDQRLTICKNHAQPFMYNGDECPWCSLATEMVKKVAAEYRRGFEDGVKAADTEYAKKEMANAKRSDDRKESPKADTAVPADVPKK